MSCIVADTSCCAAWDGFDEDVQDRAAALAADTFSMLTGYRVGGCPVTVRPCRRGCLGARTWATFPAPTGVSPMLSGTYTGGWVPLLRDGAWVNLACGCGISEGCSCTHVCEVLLPGEVGRIDTVLVDGDEVERAEYRLDAPNRLVAVGDACWPLCQDMAALPDEPGTFAVTFTPGPLPEPSDEWAVGILACEYAAACTGGKCRLPAGVTSVARQGVSYTINPGVFPNGFTGIPEVDARVRRWNPHTLGSPSLVWSPDIGYGRAPR